MRGQIYEWVISGSVTNAEYLMRFFFFFFLAGRGECCGFWDLSSLTRDQPMYPAWES